MNNNRWNTWKSWALGVGLIVLIGCLMHPSANAQVTFQETKVASLNEMCKNPAKHGVLGCLRGEDATFLLLDYQKKLFVEEDIAQNHIEAPIQVRIYNHKRNSIRETIYLAACPNSMNPNLRIGNIETDSVDMGLFGKKIEVKNAVPGTMNWQMANWLCSDKTPITKTINVAAESARQEAALKKLEAENEERQRPEREARAKQLQEEREASAKLAREIEERRRKEEEERVANDERMKEHFRVRAEQERKRDEERMERVRSGRAPGEQEGEFNPRKLFDAIDRFSRGNWR